MPTTTLDFKDTGLDALIAKIDTKEQKIISLPRALGATVGTPTPAYTAIGAGSAAAMVNSAYSPVSERKISSAPIGAATFTASSNNSAYVSGGGGGGGQTIVINAANVILNDGVGSGGSGGYGGSGGGCGIGGGFGGSGGGGRGGAGGPSNGNPNNAGEITSFSDMRDTVMRV
jgi:hypothetical protein